MTFFRRLALSVALMAPILGPILMDVVSGPALAADPVFPPGFRIGVVPPPPMTPARGFPGFEDAQNKASLTLVELPLQAFDELSRGFTAEAAVAQGVTLDRREDASLKVGEGFIVAVAARAGDTPIHRWALVAKIERMTVVVTIQFPDSAAATYPDELLRQTLTSVALREVPEAEFLQLLPYTLNNRDGFRVVRVGPGGTALLTDGSGDEVDLTAQSMFLIVVSGGTPDPAERDSVARRAIASTPGVKEIRIQRSEPLRIAQGQGHEIIAQAKEPKSDTPMMIVQWLRFGTSGFVRMIGVARQDKWTETYQKFRDIRDGFALR